MLVALVMLVAGFIVGGSRGTTLLGTGLVLGSLAGLELSVREHFGGFRSHTILLAATAAVAAAVGLYYLAGLSAALALAAGIAAFAICALLLARAFRTRTGRAVKLK